MHTVCLTDLVRIKMKPSKVTLQASRQERYKRETKTTEKNYQWKKNRLFGKLDILTDL